MKNKLILTLLFSLSLISFAACGEEEAQVEEDLVVEYNNISLDIEPKKEKVYRGESPTRVVYHTEVSGSLSGNLSRNSVEEEDAISRGPIRAYRDDSGKGYDDEYYEGYMGVEYAPGVGYIESVRTDDDSPDGYIESNGYMDRREQGYTNYVSSDRKEGYLAWSSREFVQDGYVENSYDRDVAKDYLEYFYEECLEENDGDEDECELLRRENNYAEDYEGVVGHEGYLGSYEGASGELNYAEMQDEYISEGYVEGYQFSYVPQGNPQSYAYTQSDGYIQNTPSYWEPGYNEWGTASYRTEGYVERLSYL